ncbi:MULTISPECIES: hypothetical protein [unclassified Streptomyces]|uniref:hypothetical protein n=1 Tax=unclassified Streptomyces TaxID=2593676 RepID=UPI0035D7A6BF
MNAPRTSPMKVAAWLAITVAGVIVGSIVAAAWLKFLCLIVASAALRLVLHALWPRKSSGPFGPADGR